MKCITHQNGVSVQRRILCSSFSILLPTHVESIQEMKILNFHELVENRHKRMSSSKISLSINMFTPTTITALQQKEGEETLEEIDISALSRFGVRDVRLVLCSREIGLLLCCSIFPSNASTHWKVIAILLKRKENGY